MAQDKKVKRQLTVLQDHSLRGLLQQVNVINSGNEEDWILKEDIVEIIREDETFFLVYFR
jgi:hypothetical protein